MHPMTQGRELALQFLYMQDVTAESASFDDFLAVFGPKGLGGQAKDLAKALVSGVGEHKKEIDDGIQAASANWKVERMPVVDRNIIRMGMVELSLCGTPKNVVINEAIELAKKFGSDKGPQFVNGVLDKIKNNS